MTVALFHAAFAAVLLAAAAEDVRRRRISNLFPIMLVVLFAGVALWRGETETLFLHFLSFISLFVLGAVLFTRGIIGGGDVKLMAAAALWFEVTQLPALLLAIALCGGVLALVLVAHGIFLSEKGAHIRRADRRRKKTVPYGLAIAAGTLIVMGPDLLRL